MSREQKLILWISILASFVAFLDGSVTNVALPAISHELGGGLVIQEWVSDAYLITLGSLILAAGSFSDIFGRKRILTIGLYGFLATSILCAAAPTGEILIASRALQGVAGALLVPSSLALIISHFKSKSQAKAIGIWTAWTGVAFIIGPLVGGMLVDLLSWRLVFLINIVPIILALGMLRLTQPEKEKLERKQLDYVGMILCAAGLAGVVFGLIEQLHLGWDNPLIVLTLGLGIVCLISFFLYEKSIAHPVLPLSLFRIGNFSSGNIATFFIYAALSLQGFILVIFLQEIAHYSATEAGLASLPVTIVMLLLSSRFGSLAGTYGPRLFMTIGPLLAAIGAGLLLMIEKDAPYLQQVFPGVLCFGLGLSVTVAPLTSAILGSIPPERAGIGSAINNAVARIAGLLAIATVGLFMEADVITLRGFHVGLTVCVLLLVLGGIISYAGIRNNELVKEA